MALAAAAASDDYSEETIQKAIAKCNESPTELDLAASGMENSDQLQLCMGLAIFAIAKAIGDLDDDKSKQEAQKTGLAARLEEMQKKAEDLKK